MAPIDHCDSMDDQTFYLHADIVGTLQAHREARPVKHSILRAILRFFFA